MRCSPRTEATERPARTGDRRWWGLVTLALAVGYADLWRGGLTFGPMALVAAYGVLLPIAIVRG
jgi:hypothetical protein